MPFLREDVAQDVRACAEELDRKGGLLSRAQLEEYRATFRRRFGPDVLGQLDGERLLMTMHGGIGSDSLSYWLEFKNDEEFPAKFGSIAGGSAFKFGVFFNQEKQAWITGSPNKPEELSIHGAIEKARAQRDELLLGAQLISEFPNSVEDTDYQRLQNDLRAIAPHVQDSAWGHKYFSLLFPDKLDDYHNADYGRFHLIKLLQVPPADCGRYATAGRFVAMSEQLDLPINSITRTLNVRDGGKPCTYWRIGTTIGPSGPSEWESMVNGRCVAIGWPQIGDLGSIAHIADKAARKVALVGLLQEKYNEDGKIGNGVIGNYAGQIGAFIAEIAKDDVAVAMDGATVMGIGKVVGSYFYDQNHEFPNRLPVSWYSLERWRMSPPEQLMSTVRRLGKFPQHLVEAEKRIYGKPAITGNPNTKSGAPAEHTDQPAALIGLTARIQNVLQRKGQVILYGPPGTGKTYWARKSTCELAARNWFSRAFETLSESEKDTINAHAVRFCCFHPAYGYEDFLEGYRPELVGGEMVFQRREGVFKRLCYEAEAAPSRNFYLIIDEINRGDIPRIFGELMTVIEKNKRGMPMLLPLSGQTFRVPQNVFLIGTMNTADRSIALLDAALRRRFGFIELLPDSSLLGDTVLNGLPLRPWMDALNQSIINHIGHDGRNLQVGHSYFLNERGKPVDNFATFSCILEEDVVPLLQEYCYEDFRVLESILGNSLIDVSKQRIRQEMFDEDRTDDLVAALIAPFPSVATAIIPSMAEEETDANEDEIDVLDADNEEMDPA